MSKKIIFNIITPERVVFEREIFQATLPVIHGVITILPNHRSYIGALKAGEIILKDGNEEILLATSGGFVEFHKNKLIVLADTAEVAEEIDLKRAEDARKRAEELKNEKISMDEIEYARVAAMIEKEMTRVRVARKHHTKHGIKID